MIKLEAIFILLFFDLVLLFIAFYKKDSSLLLLCGILNVLTGLNIINHGLGNLFNFVPFGWIIIFLGIYIIVRTGIDMMTLRNKNIKKEVKQNGISEKED